MLDLPYYWIGPLGALVPMACPEGTVTSGLRLVGNIQQALNGRQMMDVTAYRREWDMSESWLDANDFAFLETMLATTHDQTLRLIDPLIENRARLFASLTSDFVGYAQVRNAWKVSAGAAPTFPLGAWPAISYTSQGDARDVTYGGTRHVLWTLSAAATLSVNGAVTGGVTSLEDVDAARVGEVLTVSAWIKTTGAATVAIRLTGVDSVGTLTTNASSAQTANANWTRISATYTVASGDVGVIPQFVTTTTSGTISIAGIMINEGNAPGVFVRGGGSSEVIMSGLSTDSPRFPLINAQIALSEV